MELAPIPPEFESTIIFPSPRKKQAKYGQLEGKEILLVTSVSHLWREADKRFGIYLAISSMESEGVRALFISCYVIILQYKIYTEMHILHSI